MELQSRSSVRWERCWATSATSWPDLGVVDGVEDGVGDGGIRFAHVQPQVDHQALADLALGLADAVVRVQRQAADLDRDGLGGLLAILADLLALVVVEVVYVVVASVGVHRPPNVAAVTASATRNGATSCTRKMLAPRS